MKNNKARRLAVVAFAGLVLLTAFRLYFAVDGAQVSRLIGNTDRVQLTKTRESSEKSEPLHEVGLEGEALNMLLDLLESTKFQRIISKSTPFTDQDRYIITVSDDRGRVSFRLEAYGGEFVLVDASDGQSAPTHWKLRIKSDRWKSTLDEIIAYAEASR